jgi:hypothetical protein
MELNFLRSEILNSIKNYDFENIKLLLKNENIELDLLNIVLLESIEADENNIVKECLEKGGAKLNEEKILNKICEKNKYELIPIFLENRTESIIILDEYNTLVLYESKLFEIMDILIKNNIVLSIERTIYEIIMHNHDKSNLEYYFSKGLMTKEIINNAAFKCLLFDNMDIIDFLWQKDVNKCLDVEDLMLSSIYKNKSSFCNYFVDKCDINYNDGIFILESMKYENFEIFKCLLDKNPIVTDEMINYAYFHGYKDMYHLLLSKINAENKKEYDEIYKFNKLVHFITKDFKNITKLHRYISESVVSRNNYDIIKYAIYYSKKDIIYYLLEKCGDYFDLYKSIKNFNIIWKDEEFKNEIMIFVRNTAIMNKISKINKCLVEINTEVDK